MKHKRYTYRGYTFYKTDTLLAISGKNLYKIDGLKDRAKQPRLTTIEECKEYIRRYGKQ